MTCATTTCLRKIPPWRCANRELSTALARLSRRVQSDTAEPRFAPLFRQAPLQCADGRQHVDGLREHAGKRIATLDFDATLRSSPGSLLPQLVQKSAHVSGEASGALLGAKLTVKNPQDEMQLKVGPGEFEGWFDSRPGGTAPKTPLQDMTKPRWMDGYQLSLRMDDGTVQAITQNSSEFHAGDRVQVTQEGRVLKVPGSQASAGPVVRPGSGTIQSVTPTGTSAQQVSMNMDDGTTQIITLQGAAVRPGERVTITADGHMMRP
jgi:outer membrane lipoprotein SlyB